MFQYLKMGSYRESALPISIRFITQYIMVAILEQKLPILNDCRLDWDVSNDTISEPPFDPLVMAMH